MADRLRDLIDLVLASLDDPDGRGAELARRASFSRDHLDRLLSAATGETPAALRRRLLLERAAWQLREGATASRAAEDAGYGSLAAFSRAFARAHGVAPSAFAASGRPVALEAPNGVHFLGPAGLFVPAGGAAAPTGPDDGPGRAGRAGGESPAGAGGDSAGRRGGPGVAAPPAPRDLTERMVLHHLARTRELLDVAATLPADALARPLRPGFVACWFEGEEPSAALMAERLVATLEVWVAAILGEPAPASAVPGAAASPGSVPGRAPAAADPATATAPAAPGDLRARLDRAGRSFSAIARRVRDEGAWDDAFVDALCEPPQAFTLGGVLAHVLTFGAIRREMLASVLTELGATVPSSGDPIEWEAGR